jgi:hypothetical protein
MRQWMRPVALGSLIVLLGIGGVGLARAVAQPATPESGAENALLILVEHADRVTEVDLGETGPSIGDMIVWGPNALFDESNATDTGAVTQGSCIAFDDSANCVGTETIVFADGSTLHFQGVERGGGVPSMRTIIGGSGRYLGATGTMSVEPSADLLLWTKTIEIAAPTGRP